MRGHSVRPPGALTGARLRAARASHIKRRRAASRSIRLYSYSSIRASMIGWSIVGLFTARLLPL